MRGEGKEEEEEEEKRKREEEEKEEENDDDKEEERIDRKCLSISAQPHNAWCRVTLCPRVQT